MWTRSVCGFFLTLVGAYENHRFGINAHTSYLFQVGHPNSVTCITQWVCHAINKSSICVFLPQRTSIFRPQNYLAYACCMKPGCSEMIQSVSPLRAQCQKYIPSPSLITDYRGGFRIFRRGGHTLIERAISYHFSQEGYHVRACTTGTRGHPRRAVPGTVWGRDYIE